MSKLYKNGSGCYDPTAFNAIVNASKKDEGFDNGKTRRFVKDIFIVCKSYNVFIDGEVDIMDRKTGKFLRKISMNKKKGEE